MEGQKVNHPLHYGGANGIEAIDAIEAAMGFSGVLHFCQGNALKYLFRAGVKPDNSAIQDFRKARWYINKAIEMLEREEGFYREKDLLSEDREDAYSVCCILNTNIAVTQPMPEQDIVEHLEQRLAECNLGWSVDNVSIIKHE